MRARGRSATGKLARADGRGVHKPAWGAPPRATRVRERARDGQTRVVGRRKKTATALEGNRAGVPAPNRSCPPARDRAPARGCQHG